MVSPMTSTTTSGFFCAISCLIGVVVAPLPLRTSLPVLSCTAPQSTFLVISQSAALAPQAPMECTLAPFATKAALSGSVRGFCRLMWLSPRTIRVRPASTEEDIEGFLDQIMAKGLRRELFGGVLAHIFQRGTDGSTPFLVALGIQMLTIRGGPLPWLGELQRVDIAARRDVGREKRRHLFDLGVGLAVLAALCTPVRPNPGALRTGRGNGFGQTGGLLPDPGFGERRLVITGHGVTDHDQHQVRLVLGDQLLDRRGSGLAT